MDPSGSPPACSAAERPVSCGSIRRPACPKSIMCRRPASASRGGDIDGNGVVWASLSSGHLASFDRRKCKGPLNGPKATGDHCPEGWSFYKYPGPGFEGVGDNSAEASYYTWVDQHNTLGLGDNVPISTGQPQRRLRCAEGRQDGDAARSISDGLLCQGLGRPHRRSERRLEGPRPVVVSGDRAPWLKEGGKGAKPLAVQFQVRPDPLAN